MLLINRETKNDVLMNMPEVFIPVQQKNVVLIDKVPTSNPKYTTLYFVGLVETTSSNSVSGAQAELLEWTEKNEFIMRCSQNATTDKADTFEIGKVFPAFALQIVDTTSPAYDKHAPRMSKEGEIYVNEEGKAIYRTARLVTKDELAVEGHKTIKRATTKAVTSSAKVSAMFEV